MLCELARRKVGVKNADADERNDAERVGPDGALGATSIFAFLLSRNDKRRDSLGLLA